MLYRRIRDLREDRDLTQREMGEILLCSQRVYSDYERGVLDIPTEILIRLADAALDCHRLHFGKDRHP